MDGKNDNIHESVSEQMCKMRNHSGSGAAEKRIGNSFGLSCIVHFRFFAACFRASIGTFLRLWRCMYCIVRISEANGQTCAFCTSQNAPIGLKSISSH